MKYGIYTPKTKEVLEYYNELKRNNDGFITNSCRLLGLDETPEQNGKALYIFQLRGSIFDYLYFKVYLQYYRKTNFVFRHK